MNSKHSKKLFTKLFTVLLKEELHKWLGKTDYPDDQSQLMRKYWWSYIKKALPCTKTLESFFRKQHNIKKLRKEVKKLNETTTLVLNKEKLLLVTFIIKLYLKLSFPNPHWWWRQSHRGYKRYVFRCYCGSNPKTGQDWIIKDFLTDLLTREDLLWLQHDHHCDISLSSSFLR